jgi:hypothetical protein
MPVHSCSSSCGAPPPVRGCLLSRTLWTKRGASRGLGPLRPRDPRGRPPIRRNGSSFPLTIAPKRGPSSRGTPWRSGPSSPRTWGRKLLDSGRRPAPALRRDDGGAGPCHRLPGRPERMPAGQLLLPHRRIDRTGPTTTADLERIKVSGRTGYCSPAPHPLAPGSPGDAGRNVRWEAPPACLFSAAAPHGAAGLIPVRSRTHTR